MATQAELTADEIGDRGEAIYEERLRAELESSNVGRFFRLILTAASMRSAMTAWRTSTD